MTAPRDLSGLVFGRLTALQLDPSRKRRSWVCRCSCGNSCVVAQAELTQGDTQSCGCVRAEMLAARNRRGKVNHSELSDAERAAYRKWAQMWCRVRNPTGRSECYKTVDVCPQWESFECFLADMGCPPKGYSLDRINNAEGYNRDNCRWVPLAHQAKNTRRNRKVMFRGKLAIVSDHAREQGLNPDVVFDRLNRLKWGVDRALSSPVQKQKPKLRCRWTT